MITLLTTTPLTGNTDFAFSGSSFNFFTAKGNGLFKSGGKHTEKSLCQARTDTGGCALLDLKPTNSQVAHGWIMFIAWGLLVPTAILSAVNKSNLACFKEKQVAGMDLWFFIHRVCNVIAVLLTIIGFIIAVNMTNVDHFSFAHAQVGLIVFIIALAQPVLGMLRPHNPHKGEKKSAARKAFEVVHKYMLGLIGMILGLLNCASGLTELHHHGADTDGTKMAMLAWAVIVFILYIVGYVLIFMKGSDDKEVELDSSSRGGGIAA